MKKGTVLTGVFLFFSMMLSGCQKDYYGKGQAFNQGIERLPGYSNATISQMSADNYERFMHASYIVVTDKLGQVQKIKIRSDIQRHEWDFDNLETDGNFKNYVEADGSRKRTGIDVSEHQGEINWKKVSQTVDFAIIRLGYRGYTTGGIALDAYYTSNMDGATAHDMPVGVYFYSQATSYEEGVEEAQFVLENLGEYELSYPIVLDREDPDSDDARTNNLSAEEHTQAALGFLETIKAAGYQPMMYTYRTYYSLYLDLAKIYEYPIWYAQYADEPDWPYEFSLWQYTESGEVPGIAGLVDLNLEMLPPNNE